MIDKILAKSSGETLSEHTIACLRAAQTFLGSLPLPEAVKRVIKEDVLLAVAMHDVGKAATGFQKVLRKEQQNWLGKRHEIISASFASSVEGVSPATIFAILTHHKSIPSEGISQIFGCLPSEQIPLPGWETPVWNEMAQEWEENGALFLQEWRKILEYIEHPSLQDHGLLKTLFLNPSWLERTTVGMGQRKIISFQDRYHASIVRGLTISSDHLGSANKVPPPIPDLGRFSVLNKKPRPFQEHINTIEGSAILRAPTGSGKTEAALLWAQRNQRPNGRLFYVLPYTASINAMYHRLKKVFGEGNVGLLHHRATAALYNMLESNADASSRLDKQQTATVLADLAHEIWFPIRVCTPHQILRYILRGKGWETMLAEFPNACFIFDEIHAYDPRVVGLTLGSAKLLSQLGARFLFLSATLPAFLFKLIIDILGELPLVEPDPLQETDRKILEKKRHFVEVKVGSLLDHIETMIQAISGKSSTLIVCNHVKTSQRIYSLLKQNFPNETIRLLHGRFNQEDRNRIEKEIIGKPLPKVLVATQVVEVSLDMDFDQAFSEPAPIDALIQRMGRVNRSGSRPPAKVVIFRKQVNSYNLYCGCSGEHENNCKVKLTIDALQKLQNPISETDLIMAANRVYGKGFQREEETKFNEGLNHPDIKEFEERLLAGSYQDWVDTIIEKTDGVAEILPKSLLEKYKEREEKGLWVEANSLFVPIRRESLSWLQPKLDQPDGLWVMDLTYTSDSGLEMG